MRGELRLVGEACIAVAPPEADRERIEERRLCRLVGRPPWRSLRPSRITSSRISPLNSPLLRSRDESAAAGSSGVAPSMGAQPLAARSRIELHTWVAVRVGVRVRVRGRVRRKGRGRARVGGEGERGWGRGRRARGEGQDWAAHHAGGGAAASHLAVDDDRRRRIARDCNLAHDLDELGQNARLG